MTKRTLMHYFIEKALADQGTDLSVYHDHKFAHELRMVAIDAIVSILLKINSEQLFSKTKDKTFSLLKVINTKHPQTGLSILDYCLVAGFYELAFRLFLAGANSQYIPIFAVNMAKFLAANEFVSPILEDIQETLNRVNKVERKRSLSRSNSEDRGYLQRIEGLAKDHPYPMLLFTVGAVCSVISPFVHGAGTVMLLSVGIPSLLSSINAMQASKNGKDNKVLSEEHDRIAAEVKEIEALIDMAKKLKSEIQQGNIPIRQSSKFPHEVSEESDRNYILNSFSPRSNNIAEQSRRQAKYAL